MATFYVNSAVVGGTGSGNSWANASPTISQSITNSAAGDDFNVVYTHSESNASIFSLTFKGTITSPNRVFSCTTANAPATASDLRSGAVIATTANNTFTINGYIYVFGVNFNVGSGVGVALFSLGSNSSELVFDSCNFNHLATSTNSTDLFGTPTGNSGTKITFSNTTINYNGGTGCGMQCRGTNFRWLNTANAIGGTQTALSNLFISPSIGSMIYCDGVDFTGIASGKNLVQTISTTSIFNFVNCKTTSGTVVTPSPTIPSAIVDFIVSDSSNTGYRQERYTYQGTLVSSSTTTLIGGATDGINPISWRIITTANPELFSPFECFMIGSFWNGTLGSSRTATIQILGPSGLTNADVFVELYYLGTSSSPISTILSSGPATQLTPGIALTSSVSLWNTPGTNVAYSISLNFTPQIAGLVRAIVKIAKISATIYVDPKMVIS